jgi:hypothetical protein
MLRTSRPMPLNPGVLVSAWASIRRRNPSRRAAISPITPETPGNPTCRLTLEPHPRHAGKTLSTDTPAA